MKALASLALLLGGLAAPQGAAPANDPLAEARRLLGAGEHGRAEALLWRRVEADESDAAAWFLLARALDGQGRHDEALEGFDRSFADPRLAPRAAFGAACMHAHLEDLPGAFAWLDRAVAAGFQDRPLLFEEPALGPLRSDPRFAKLLPPLLEGAEAFVEPTRVLHTFLGEAAGDQFGWVARDVGDLDGDGVHDFATTAPTHSGVAPGAGRVYVYSSKEGELLFTADGRPGAGLGAAIAGRADLDGDGTPDVLTGAPASGTAAGYALALSGKDGRVLLEVSAGEAGDGFGTKVCGIEDLDGDGCDELVVGALNSDANGVNSGRVYVYSGKRGTPLFRIDGEAAGDQLGSSTDATLVGGHGLLIVGAMGARGGGRAFVYHCTAEGAEPAFTIDPDATSANLGQFFVTVLGDVDGDGTPDVYASDWNNSGPGPNAGRVFVHSGASGDRLLTLDGHTPGEGFGTSPALCGDVDGDGSADLVVGAWQHSSAAPSGGRVYLYSGKDGKLLRTWTSRQAGDTLGFDAVGLGDVDGDGKTDFLVTSAWSAVRGPRTGRVFVVAGE